MPTIFDYPEYLLSQCSVIRMANNQQTLIGSSQDFFPLADHSIFGECSGASSKQVVDDCSRSLLRSCKLVPKLQTSKKIRKFASWRVWLLFVLHFEVYKCEGGLYFFIFYDCFHWHSNFDVPCFNLTILFAKTHTYEAFLFSELYQLLIQNIS